MPKGAACLFWLLLPRVYEWTRTGSRTCIDNVAPEQWHLAVTLSQTESLYLPWIGAQLQDMDEKLESCVVAFTGGQMPPNVYTWRDWYGWEITKSAEYYEPAAAGVHPKPKAPTSTPPVKRSKPPQPPRADKEVGAGQFSGGWGALTGSLRPYNRGLRGATP